MMYDYQLSAQVAETRRQDLMESARISRLRKEIRTRNAQTRPQRRWLGLGPRQTQTTCTTAA